MAAQTRRDLFLNIGGDVTGLAAAMKAGRSALLTLGTAANDVQGEVKKALAEMTANAPAAARQLERSFNDTVAQVRRNAQNLRDAPTPEAAVQILNVSAAEQAAAAAERNAAALRVNADAAATVAARSGEAGAAARLLAVAFELEAQTTAEGAVALRNQANLLREVATQAGLTVDAQDEVGHGTARLGASSQIAEHVVRAFSDSVAAGQSPLRALTIELPRVSEALIFFAQETKATEGAIAGFATFLTSGLGLALSAAISLLAPFAAGLLEGAEAADTDAQAHSALKDAVDRLIGSQASLNHATRQGIQDDLDAAEATRTREIQVRKLIDAELEAAKAKRSAAEQTMANPGGSVPGSMFSAGGAQQADAQRDIDILTKTQELNEKKRLEAEKAIRVGRGKLIARGIEDTTDPKSKVKHTYEDEEDRLTRLHDSGKLSDAAFQAALLKATNARDTADDALKPGRRGRKPREDHTAERAANRDRAYEGELSGAESRLAKARLALADTAEGRLAIELADLRTALAAKDREIDDEVRAKKLTPAEAAKLKAVEASTEAAEEEAAQRKALNANLDQQIASARAALELKGSLLQLKAGLTTDPAQKRQFGLAALDNSDAIASLDPNRVLADKNATPDAKAAAQQQLDAIAAEHPLKAQEINQQTQGPLANYGDELQRNVGNMRNALEQLKVDGLKGVEDGLLGILDGTKSAAQGFRDMVKTALAELEKLAIEKGILAIFGLKDGGMAGTGSLLHFATGGHVTGPGGPRDDRIPAMLSAGEFVVNAPATARNRRLLEALNSGSLSHFADGGIVGADRFFYRPLPSAASVAPPLAPPQIIHVVTDKSALFDTHVVRLTAPMSQAAVYAGAEQAKSDLADQNAQRIPI